MWEYNSGYRGTKLPYTRWFVSNVPNLAAKHIAAGGTTTFLAHRHRPHAHTPAPARHQRACCMLTRARLRGTCMERVYVFAVARKLKNVGLCKNNIAHTHTHTHIHTHTLSLSLTHTHTCRHNDCCASPECRDGV